MSEDYFDSNNLYVFLYKYKKPIIIVAVLAFISSSVISYLIPDKYKSKVVLYPSSTSSVAKALVAEHYNGKTDIMEFGEEEKSEQLLEILSSEKVRNKVVEKFNLMNHYGIDSSTTSTPFHDLGKTYEDNIRFKRNKNMAVEIEVLDESADTAALIANYTAHVLDEVLNEIQKERAIQAFQLVKNVHDDFVSQMNLIEDSLRRIMERGVVDVKSQAESYALAYSEAVNKGNSKATEEIQKKMDLLSKYGAQNLSLVEQIENERVRYSVVKAKYEEAKLDAESRIKNFFTVARAYPAEKKSYPIRWLIVVVSTIVSTFLGMVAIFFYEKMQTVKSQLK